MVITSSSNIDQRIERIRDILESGSVREAGRLINSLAPAEIAHLLESLPQTEREILWGLVEDENDGEILLLVTDEVRAGLMRKMDPTELLSVTENLDLDDLADLVQDLPSAVTREIIRTLDDQSRHRLESVLSFDEDTAGGLMNPVLVTIRPEVTLDVVLRYLRLLGDQVPDDTDQLFVVNRLDEYLGILKLSALVSSDQSKTVAEVMSLNLSPVTVETPETEVAKRFEHFDLLSAPVVNSEGKLLGRITIDDIVDVIREEGEHQFMSQAGLSEEEDMFAPVITSAKRRALWLGLNLLTAFLASWVIGQFEATISQIVALAVLMPIVASMGGIAGSQTLALAIRGLALGQLSGKNARYLLMKEISVGALNGILWAMVVGLVTGLWFSDLMLALLIAIAITINLLAAAISGAVIPLTLHRLGIDPALAGSVLLTTVTDVVGFMAFLGLASLVLA